MIKRIPKEGRITYSGDPINKWHYLPWDRLLLSLKRMRDRIAAGLNLRYEDSNEVGNKYTTATWGQCSDEKEQWPDKEDHIWPDEFAEQGRVAPLYRDGANGQKCPFDTHPTGSDGCFYHCRIFKNRKFNDGRLPTRKEALELYDKEIERGTILSEEYSKL